MAIAYSPGVIVNQTFVPTTKTDMVDGIKNNLINADWTVVSGSSGNWVLKSVETAQNLQMRILIDNTPTNCARIRWANADGSITSTVSAFLLPDGFDWRIIASNYGFFVMRDASPTADKRDFAMGFTPYIPSFLTITECVVGGSRSLSDTQTSSQRSFRDALTYDGVNSNTSAYYTLINGTAFNPGTFESDIGTLRMRCGGSARCGGSDFTNSSCETFFDGTFFMDTPYICFGGAGSTIAATANGVIYDAVVVENSYAYGTVKTFDSHDWMAITHSNSGSSSNALWRGTLFARIT